MIHADKVISLVDFSKGLNTKAGPLGLQEGETPSCLNCTTNIYKTLLRRNGFTQLNASVAELNGNGLYDFGKDSATHIPIASFGTQIYWSTLGGTLTSIKTGRTDCINHYSNFIDASNNAHLIVTNDSADVPQTWDGVAGSTSDITAMSTLVKNPGPNVTIVYDFYLMLINGTSTINYSDVGVYGTWSVGNHFTEATADGEGFIGWGILNGILYAFKQHSIWRITNTGSTPLWTRRQVESIGAVSPRTICNVTIPGIGALLMFLGPDARVYMFDGSVAIPVSTQIEGDNGIAPVSLGTINKNRAVLANAWAVNYEPNYQYILNFTNELSSGNNAQLIYDYSARSWWAYDNMNFKSGALLTNSLGQRQVFGAGYDGYIYTLYVGDNDNGLPINSFYFSRKLDSKAYTSLKKSIQVWVTVKVIGDYSLTFQYRLDWKTGWITTENITQTAGEYLLGTTFILGTSTLGGSEALNKIFDLPHLNNLIQFKVADNSTNPPWNVYSIDMPAEFLGVAKA